LQDDLGAGEDQPRTTEHMSGSGEDLSTHETEFTENLPKVPQRWRPRKSHYVAPPPVPTNPNSQPITKLVGER
jgi:hypothetical protein